MSPLSFVGGSPVTLTLQDRDWIFRRRDFHELVGIVFDAFVIAVKQM